MIPFDGYNAMAARRVYLKPYFLPADKPYWQAVREGALGAQGEHG